HTYVPALFLLIPSQQQEPSAVQARLQGLGFCQNLATPVAALFQRRKSRLLRGTPWPRTALTTAIARPGRDPTCSSRVASSARIGIISSHGVGVGDGPRRQRLGVPQGS